MTAKQWVLVVTKPQREHWAATNVSRLRCSYYLPMCQEGGKVKPLFPRYLFVEIENVWRFLLSTWGVSSVVMRGETPDIVNPAIIEALKARENDESVIMLDEEEVTDNWTKCLCKGQTSSARQKILMNILEHNNKK